MASAAETGRIRPAAMPCYHLRVSLRYHVLTGPTAAGKTALLLELARQARPLVISADSRQVYRGMDIGTGKASVEEQARLPHRVIDVADPGEEFSAFSFVQHAADGLREARESGLPALVCGGTGLYIRALVDRLPLGGAPRPRLREALSAMLDRVGPRETAALLRLDLAEPDNPVRVLRAAENSCTTDPGRRDETYRALGLSAEEMERDDQAALRQQPPAAVLRELELWECGGTYVLDPGKPALEQLIHERVTAMFSGGLLAEVARLRELGFGDQDVVRDGIAYREAGQVLDGALQQDEAIERSVIRTRQYAKRQRTYFRGQGWAVVAPERIVEALLAAGGAAG